MGVELKDGSAEYWEYKEMGKIFTEIFVRQMIQMLNAVINKEAIV